MRLRTAIAGVGPDGPSRSRQLPRAIAEFDCLMWSTQGEAHIRIGLIDGPVALDHPERAADRVTVLPGTLPANCAGAGSLACDHGTFVAGILHARRGSAAPALCPGCTLLVRPIFAAEMARGHPAAATAEMPTATPQDLAAAITEVVAAGARIINLSAALDDPFSDAAGAVRQALDQAARRDVIVVAATGNQGSVGCSAITGHPWVIPVAACDHGGRATGLSNLGSSIGRRGLAAPGQDITSLRAAEGMMTLSGTSIAAPFVTGAVALLWSIFPTTTAAELRRAVLGTGAGRRGVVPPTLDVAAASRILASSHRRVREAA